MSRCFFASDLHGSIERYEKLFRLVSSERPDALFLGGDILPSSYLLLSSAAAGHSDFIEDYLVATLRRLRSDLGGAYPRIFVILGNDDGRFAEKAVLSAAEEGIWEYIHNRKVDFKGNPVYGYSYIPPSPFLLKDWEKYDVSRYVDPGCVSPEEGGRTFPVPDNHKKYSTIEQDLDRLAGNENLDDAIFLFHAPPYRTKLDRAALDGRMIDHVPLDVHIGSIAIRRFIAGRRPLLALHGHVHESARLSGSWRDRIGRTHLFTAAHDGPEPALVRFDPDDLERASRELV